MSAQGFAVVAHRDSDLDRCLVQRDPYAGTGTFAFVNAAGYLAESLGGRAAGHPDRVRHRSAGR